MVVFYADGVQRFYLVVAWYPISFVRDTLALVTYLLSIHLDLDSIYYTSYIMYTFLGI